MKRILLLDDNKDFGDATKEALEFFDFEVTIGLDGNDALTALNDEQKRPDIILSDLNMPAIGGDEILKIIQERPELRHIKVIIMSGASHDRQRLLTAGAHGFIEKPFRFSELHTLLLEVLENNDTP